MSNLARTSKYISKRPHSKCGHSSSDLIDRKGFDKFARFVYSQGCGLLDRSDPEDDLFCGGLSNLLDEIYGFISLEDVLWDTALLNTPASGEPITARPCKFDLTGDNAVARTCRK